MITITVNNQKKEIDTNHTLNSLLELLNHDYNGIAVAINQSIISKPNWETHQVLDGDDILIIQATQGG
mgnify:CR=1 FL=1